MCVCVLCMVWVYVVYIYIYTYIVGGLSISVCVSFIYIYMCVCVRVSVYIYIYMSFKRSKMNVTDWTLPRVEPVDWKLLMVSFCWRQTDILQELSHPEILASIFPRKAVRKRKSVFAGKSESISQWNSNQINQPTNQPFHPSQSACLSSIDTSLCNIA